LYDLETDADESYDCSEQYPEIVAQIRGEVDALLWTMPDAVREAWQDMMNRPVNDNTPGALPEPKRSR